MRDDGAFVTTPGSEHSYTTDIRHARVYLTRESAALDLCPESERVVSVEELLQEPR